MFKTIKPELEDNQIIKIRLSNSAQKDTFIQNYRQRLINFLEDRFIPSGIEIETIIDAADKNEILYSDDQKYNYLSSKYPILKEMKRNFNLDIT